MNLSRYIKGFRRGKEAHRVELEAMKDSFLSEALEGYDAIDGEHLKRIAQIQKQIKKRSYKRNETAIKNKSFEQKQAKTELGIPWRRWAIAATVFLCLLSGYYLMKDYEWFSPDRTTLASSDHQQKEALLDEIKDTGISHQDDISMVDTQEELPLPESDLIASAQISENKSDTGEKEIETIVPISAALSLRLINANENQKNLVKPEPEIGMDAFMNHLKTNAIRPADGAKGKVKLRFLVGEDGKPYNLQIINSLSNAADSEAIRLIQTGGKWKHGSEAVEIEITF